MTLLWWHARLAAFLGRLAAASIADVGPTPMETKRCLRWDWPTGYSCRLYLGCLGFLSSELKFDCAQVQGASDFFVHFVGILIWLAFCSQCACVQGTFCASFTDYVLGSTSQLSNRVVVGRSRWDSCRLSWKASKCFSAYAFCSQMFTVKMPIQALVWELTQILVKRVCLLAGSVWAHGWGCSVTTCRRAHIFRRTWCLLPKNWLHVCVTCVNIGIMFGDVWGRFGSIWAQVDESLKTHNDQKRQGTSQCSLRSSTEKPEGETSCLDLLGNGMECIFLQKASSS